jgi:hypothetical protein
MSAEPLPSSETSGPCRAVFLISRSGGGEADADATSESTRLLYSVRSMLTSLSSSVSVSAHDMSVDIAGKSGGVVHGNVHGDYEVLQGVQRWECPCWSQTGLELVVDSQLAVVAEVHPPSAPAQISADASAP